MNLQAFPNGADLNGALADVLLNALTAQPAGPFAVLLSGGRTPLPAYRQCAAALAAAQFAPPPELHLTFSDERMVPDDSPESNYGNAGPLVAALGLPPERVLRPASALPLPAAAQRWHDDFAAFLARGGRLTLGLLGLGADGHTASLFSRDDLDRSRGRWAIPVLRESGPGRVSVTPELLNRVARLIFAVAGPDKAAVVDRLIRAPRTLTAGLAVDAAPQVEVWYAPAA